MDLKITIVQVVPIYSKKEYVLVIVLMDFIYLPIIVYVVITPVLLVKDQILMNV